MLIYNIWPNKQPFVSLYHIYAMNNANIMDIWTGGYIGGDLQLTICTCCMWVMVLGLERNTERKLTVWKHTLQMMRLCVKFSVSFTLTF